MLPKTVNDYLLTGCMRCKYGATPDCKVHQWQNELSLLRKILLDTPLSETIKWGVPCYTYNQKNVVILAAFKNYVALSFFKGELLNDNYNLLEKSGENSSSGRVIKFTNLEKILENSIQIQEYILQAIEIEKTGKSVVKTKTEISYPDELLEKFKENSDFAQAFLKLTPGRQRGYIIYFTQPKQIKTRYLRIEKCISKIMEGKGLNEEDD